MPKQIAAKQKGTYGVNFKDIIHFVLHLREKKEEIVEFRGHRKVLKRVESHSFGRALDQPNKKTIN